MVPSAVNSVFRGHNIITVVIYFCGSLYELTYKYLAVGLGLQKGRLYCR